MSDDGLDAELLAMAGDSSDEGEEFESPQRSRSGTPNRGSRGVEKKEEPTSTRGVAQKVRANRRRKRKQESEDEDDFGGDGSSSPAASMGSGAMHESDSEADAPASDVEEGPLFPLEGKYLSVRDREEILAMPEIQREEILAERAQQMVKKQQDLQLKKALALAQAAGNKHKRKAAAADLEDSGRRTTRPKAEKKNDPLDRYKRARDARGTDRGRRDMGRDDRDDRSPSVVSDRDADGESEVEWAEPTSNRGRNDPPAELKDFDRCRIGRSSFAKVCFYPNFETVIKGCFCRVSIGPNRETGQNMYRMTQIRGFTEGKPYQLEGPNGKTFTTDQYAIVAHGNAEKPWPFSACSDGHFSDMELDRFTGTLRKEDLRVPSKKYLSGKLADIHEFLNAKWNDDDISAKIAKQRAMERKFDPANAAKLKREAIEKRKLEAEDNGDADEIMRCDAELAALENSSQPTNGAAAPKPKPSPSKNGALARQESLAALNAKNRAKTAEEVRRALLEERRKLQAARESATREAAAAAAAEAEAKKKLLAIPKDQMADLFGDGSDVSRAGTPGANGTPKRSRAGTPLNGVKREKSAMGSLLKKKSLDDEIIGGLDLGIDVEI